MDCINIATGLEHGVCGAFSSRWWMVDCIRSVVYLELALEP